MEIRDARIETLEAALRSARATLDEAARRLQNIHLLLARQLDAEIERINRVLEK